MSAEENKAVVTLHKGVNADEFLNNTQVPGDSEVKTNSSPPVTFIANEPSFLLMGPKYTMILKNW